MLKNEELISKLFFSGGIQNISLLPEQIELHNIKRELKELSFSRWQRGLMEGGGNFLPSAPL